MNLNRRRLMGLGIASGALLAAPTVWGQAKPRVVVIGGGAGGATAARYVARDSEGAVEVTLVEANPVHTTCFFSNLYLGGFWEYEALRSFGYGNLAMGARRECAARHGPWASTATAKTVTHRRRPRCWPMTG
jgi:sulfide dehydrogenase [flavocytochrome c] flavoprotein chain